MTEECLSVLEPIMDDTDAMNTLITFLLDAKGNMDDCDKLLFVHKNTVKYRIKKFASS